MADGLKINVDMREFNRAVSKINLMKGKDARDDLYYQGKRLLPKIVQATTILEKKVRRFIWDEDQEKWVPAIMKSGKSKMFKPKTAGRARAGWVAAWRALGLINVPRGTGLAVKIFKGLEGTFTDRTRSEFPYLEFENKVSYITKIEGAEADINAAVQKHRMSLVKYIKKKTLQRMGNYFRIRF